MGVIAEETSGGPSAMCDINTTPLIDVMLVLLTMLIITLPVMTHAVKLDMPRPNQNPPPPVKPEVVELTIDFDGTVLWNGTPATLEQIEGYFQSESTRDPQPEVHIRPDKRSRYGVTAKVLAAAQRSNMKKIGFVNVAEFRE
ncbi:MAG: biopolymer transporter ExbD [Steroidobacteraceae bacterium]|nr:biopolymer transporter ExbD [Steroidobacteraceae bacterium]MDW8260049.1 biopolymer transporter ExbD [Gammaproteobacteria bacterium]